MKPTLYKRFLFALMAILLCFSSVACGSEEEKSDGGNKKKDPAVTEEGTEAEIPVPTETVEEEFHDEIPDDELLGRIGAWRGLSESGLLQERDQYSMKTIDSKDDLDPYRQYLSNFTEEDEKMILDDTAGTCVLIELTAATENTLYGTSSIVQAGSAITIIISTDEVEEVTPLHTFFLLYFPERYYNGEVIDLVF